MIKFHTVKWLVANSLLLSASFATAQNRILSALFPLEVHASDSYQPPKSVDLARRPVLVLMEQRPLPAPLPVPQGRAFMVDRYNILDVAGRLPATFGEPLHLVLPGQSPCRLQPMEEVLLVAPTSKGGMGTHALIAKGCSTPSGLSGAAVVTGAFKRILIVEAARGIGPAPVLELQKIPEGMSPNSSTARMVIPSLNSQRVAEHEAALREWQKRQADAMKAADARGVMLKDDPRLQPFVTAMAQREKGFAPAIFIDAAETRVHFTHPDGRSIRIYFGQDGQPVFEPDRL